MSIDEIDEILSDGRCNDSLSAEIRNATRALLPPEEEDKKQGRHRSFEKLRYAPAAYGRLSDAARGMSVHSPRPLSYLTHLRVVGEVLTARDHALLECLLTVAREGDSTFSTGSHIVSLKLLRAIFGSAVRRFEIVASLERLQSRMLQLPGIRARSGRTVLMRPPERLKEWERELMIFGFDGYQRLDPLSTDETWLRILYIEQEYMRKDDKASWDAFLRTAEETSEIEGEDAVDVLLTAKETELGIPLRAAQGRAVKRLPEPMPAPPVRSPVAACLEVVPSASVADPAAWWGRSAPVAFHPVLRHAIIGDDIHFELDPFLGAYLDHRRYLPYAHLDVTRMTRFDGRYTAPIYRLLLARSFERANVIVASKRRHLPIVVERSRHRIGLYTTELSLGEIVDVTGFKLLDRGVRDQVRLKILDVLRGDMRGTRGDLLQVRRFRLDPGAGQSSTVTFDLLSLPALDRMRTGRKGWHVDLIPQEKDRVHPLDEPKFRPEHLTWRRIKERFGLDENGHDRFVNAFHFALHEALHGMVQEADVDPSHRLFRGQRLLSVIRLFGIDLAAMLFAADEARLPDLTEIGIAAGLVEDGTIAKVTHERHRRHAAAFDMPEPVYRYRPLLPNTPMNRIKPIGDSLMTIVMRSRQDADEKAGHRSYRRLVREKWRPARYNENRREDRRRLKEERQAG